MEKKVQISKEDKNALIVKIQEHFQETHEEQIGELKAMLLFDFLFQECGALIYNQGIEDAHTYVSDKLEDVYELNI